MITMFLKYYWHLYTAVVFALIRKSYDHVFDKAIREYEIKH